jgi:hypothetical protein
MLLVVRKSKVSAYVEDFKYYTTTEMINGRKNNANLRASY